MTATAITSISTEGGTVWNPAWQPTRTPLDSYTCRHGLGYSIFESSKNGLNAQAVVFVPLKDTCEVTKLTLTNTTDAPKTFSLFPMWSSVCGMPWMT